MNWPTDADGDVLRRLQEGGFDFSKPCLIDFNVDFSEWPPSQQAVRLLSGTYPSVKVYEPDGDGAGYIQFQIYAPLTYELVMRIQATTTELMAPFNGECVSWGVFG